MRTALAFAVGLLLFAPAVSWAQRRQPPRATSSPTPTASPVPSLPVLNTAPSLTHQIEGLSQQIESGMRSNQKRTIAVTELVDLNGNVTNFGRFVAEELITRLYQKRFKVIERQLLNRVISEQKLSLTGVIEPASAQQLGKILGVDAIVSGTITDLNKKLRVNARLISTETGELFAVAATEVTKDEEVLSLMTQAGLNSNIKAAETRDGVDNRTSKPEGVAAKKSTPSKIDQQGFTFEFNACKLRGTFVDCFVWVTNNVNDRELGFVADDSSMFDTNGNKYSSSGSRIANNADSYKARNLLVSGVRTSTGVRFKEVDSEIKGISLLILVYSVDNNDFSVRFRNVVIEK